MAEREKLSLVVGKATLVVTHEILPLDAVALDVQNPRIRFLAERRFGKKKASPDQLLELIRDQPGYDGLQKAIRKAGGLNDPIIVRHDGRLIEGNSRVAVFKTLHAGNKKDPRWQKIPVRRLPKNASDSVIGLLMASYHVAGKTVWRPYAQADHIYQLYKFFDCTLEEIADETRMSPKEVQQYIDAYEYLVHEVLPKAKNGDGADVLQDKFSHALEFMKRKKLETHRKDPDKRAHLAKLLLEDNIKGQEVRELHGIFENKKATQMLNEKGFKHAKEVLKATNPVATIKILKQMEALTKALSTLKQKDINLFRTEAKASALLVQLHGTIRDVAQVARVSLGVRSA